MDSIRILASDTENLQDKYLLITQIFFSEISSLKQIKYTYKHKAIQRIVAELRLLLLMKRNSLKKLPKLKQETLYFYLIH